MLPIKNQPGKIANLLLTPRDEFSETIQTETRILSRGQDPDFRLSMFKHQKQGPETPTCSSLGGSNITCTYNPGNKDCV